MARKSGLRHGEKGAGAGARWGREGERDALRRLPGRSCAESPLPRQCLIIYERVGEAGERGEREKDAMLLGGKTGAVTPLLSEEGSNKHCEGAHTEKVLRGSHCSHPKRGFYSKLRNSSFV